MDSAYMIFSAFIIGHAVSRLVFGHLTIAGSWVGVWTKSGDPLAVEVVFKEHGGLTGYFGSDGLQVAGIPFSEVTFNPPSVHFVLKGDATTAIFDGKIHDGEVNGTFTEGASKGKFLLKRAPRQESLVKSRDVVFRNRNVSLAGSLIQPVTKGSHPAIVFLHGSGPEGRWANRYLAESFAKAGFAALVYDKRGVGQSTGDWRKADFEDLASDALAGIRFLRAQVGVDPKHIGIYGHSQGGTLAPLVAEHDRRLAFLIGSAAGGIDLAKMEAYSVENSIGVRSLHPPEAEDAHRFVEEIVDVAYHRKGRETLDQMATTFKGRTWYFDPPPSTDSYWSFARGIASYVPADHWSKVKAPVLLLFGQNDDRVPPKLSSEAIISALKRAGNSNVKVRFFPNADHTFRIAMKPGGWPRRVSSYAAAIVDWTTHQILNSN